MRQRKYLYLLIALLLVSPTLFYAGDYVETALVNPNQTSRYTWVSGDGNSSVTITLVYPSYLMSGQPIRINYTLTVQFSQPYMAADIGNIGVELRHARAINSTTNIVEAWKTLNSNQVSANTNTTRPSSRISRIISMDANVPLNGTATEVLVPTTRVGINGVADVVFYNGQPNATADAQTVSVLDDQTVYSSQLSTIRLTLPWVLYQIIAAANAAVLFSFLRTRKAGRVNMSYVSELNAWRFQKSLEKLEDLLRTGRISEEKYRELRETYERKLKEVQKG